MKKKNTDKTLLRDKAKTNGIAGEVENDLTVIQATDSNNASSVNVIDNATVIKPALRIDANPIQGNKNKASQHVLNDALSNKVLKNRFVLEDVLGVGGMGIVYKARDLLKVEANDRDPYLAIKVLSDEFKSHPEAFISLQRESRKSQRIAHPNIVNVHDFDRDGDIVFMTMEYMSGKPLDSLIRQYKTTGLPTEDAWGIVKSICRALIHAHEKNIVHSDFKPGNVFVCDNGITKVFDFGIARAVSHAELLENSIKSEGNSKSDDDNIDKTLFDAGNLGALTPPYASLEMLQGKEPDIRDDIYALGCVVYEMFSGEHPFKKISADEAEKKKYKPKRISHLSNRQWRAIEKALAFRREDRIGSVKEFLRECESVYKLPILIPVVSLVIFLLSGVIYFQYSNTPTGPSENNIRSELEYKIRMELHKKNLARLLAKPLFTISWEEQVWSEIRSARVLSNKDTPWLLATEKTIYQLYLEQINQSLKNHRYKIAGVLIKNSSRYTSDTSMLAELSVRLQQAMEQSMEQSSKLIAEKNKVASLSRIKLISTTQAEQKKTKRISESFDKALANVHQQLQCDSKLQMRELDTAINKLKSLDLNRYKKLEGSLINSLASCISEIGKESPERAMEAKRYALRIFNANAIITEIVIIPRDTCDNSIAGLGSRGKRAICKDIIYDNVSGPSLVVVPGSGNTKIFAIAKYETSIRELNIFCKQSTACQPNNTDDPDLPAADVSIDIADAYMKWLTKNTDKKYRLPTKAEWAYAAESKSVFLDPNRNCQLSTRGIQKGLELLKTRTGKQNSWGLVNYVGNIQEWVYDRGKVILVAGGSYDSPMENCTINSYHVHSGEASPNTGFRVLREVN